MLGEKKRFPFHMYLSRGACFINNAFYVHGFQSPHKLLDISLRGRVEYTCRRELSTRHHIIGCYILVSEISTRLLAVRSMFIIF